MAGVPGTSGSPGLEDDRIDRLLDKREYWVNFYPDSDNSNPFTLNISSYLEFNGKEERRHFPYLMLFTVEILFFYLNF